MAQLILFLTVAIAATSYGQQIGNGTVRLYQNGTTSPAYSQGIVQVYLNGEWGNICRDDLFSRTEADTICYQLGYTAAATYGSAYNSSFGLDDANPVMKELKCSSSNYQVITQCSFKRADNSSCANLGDAYVSCYLTRIWDNPFPGMVRLVQGKYSSEGLVEVYCNGQWGTVCDDDIDDDEADTICIQLGYSRSFKWDSLTIQGNATQPIWLQRLYCGHTDKTCIGYCQACPASQTHVCHHGEDMTVQCTYDTSSSSTGSLRSTCKNITSPGGLTLMMYIIIAVSSFIALIICCLLIVGLPVCICRCRNIAAVKKLNYTSFDGQV